MNTYHHENLKDALIETVLVMLEEKGLESITLREVTARTGSSRTSVYRHFSSKEHLFQSVILKGFGILGSVLKPILLDQNSDIQERLKRMGKAYIEFAEENTALYRLMLGEQLSKLRESSCEDSAPSIETGFESLVALIREGHKSKEFLAGSAEIQASSIWAIIHGQASLLIDNHFRIQDNRDAIIEETLDLVVRGYFP